MQIIFEMKTRLLNTLNSSVECQQSPPRMAENRKQRHRTESEQHATMMRARKRKTPGRRESVTLDGRIFDEI